MPFALALITLAAAAPDATALRAHAAVDQACGRCHRGGEADEGGFDFLFDRDALIREQLVIPGRPGQSRLLMRVRYAEMPPPDAPERKWRGSVVTALDAWIRAGAPAEKFSTVKPSAASAVLRDVLLHAVKADLEKLSEPERRNARYFSGAAAELGPALAKTVSSLTWSSALVVPTQVLPQQLYRVDLRDLGWSTEDWNRVLLVYPFGITDSSFDEEIAQNATQTAQPLVRGDWFVANATRPPLYYALLKVPSNEAGLEALLGVNVKSDIARRAVVRAGFNNSGISQNNRLIERHATRFGPYWRSYDFASNVGAKNLFERPLSFIHDGGEHLFTLPNGLLGFMLTDGHGGRIDRGPTAIVRDERRPDGAVENALSCMGCHARGFIPKADQLLPSVLASPAGFTGSERREVAALHPEAEILARVFPLDSTQLLDGLARLGVPVDDEEPITAAAARYERALDLKQCAAELGVPPHVLFRALERGPEAMAPLRVGGNVKRDAFVAAFPQLIRRVGAGQAIVSTHGVAPAECGVAGGNIETRAEDCALVFPQRATVGAFRLVSRSAAGREVWLDSAQRLLWSPAQASASQSDAAAQCSGEQSVDALWFLPSAAELEQALAAGLPGAGWQPLWSRDADNSHKLEGAGGIALSPSGRTNQSPQTRLASRCVARL